MYCILGANKLGRNSPSQSTNVIQFLLLFEVFRVIRIKIQINSQKFYNTYWNVTMLMHHGWSRGQQCTLPFLAFWTFACYFPVLQLCLVSFLSLVLVGLMPWMFHSLMKFYCVLSSYSLVYIFLLGALVVPCLAIKVQGLFFKFNLLVASICITNKSNTV